VIGTGSSLGFGTPLMTMETRAQAAELFTDVCPNCGNNTPRDNFCISCGHSLAHETTVDVDPAADGAMGVPIDQWINDELAQIKAAADEVTNDTSAKEPPNAPATIRTPMHRCTNAQGTNDTVVKEALNAPMPDAPIANDTSAKDMLYPSVTVPEPPKTPLETIRYNGVVKTNLFGPFKFAFLICDELRSYNSGRDVAVNDVGELHGLQRGSPVSFRVMIVNGRIRATDIKEREANNDDDVQNQSLLKSSWIQSSEDAPVLKFGLYGLPLSWKCFNCGIRNWRQKPECPLCGQSHAEGCSLEHVAPEGSEAAAVAHACVDAQEPQKAAVAHACVDAKELAVFWMKYPVDDAAKEYLLVRSENVVQYVLETFRPAKFAEDYSKHLMAYVMRVVSLNEELTDFLTKCEVDEKAKRYLLSSSEDVLRAVLHGFHPPPGTDRSQYSRQLVGYVTWIYQRKNHLTRLLQQYPVDADALSYVLRCSDLVIQTVLQSWQAPQGLQQSDYSRMLVGMVNKIQAKKELVDYMLRFPVDDKAKVFLLRVPDDVTRNVLEAFCPTHGLTEGDYSRLLVSYVKRILKKKADICDFMRMFPISDDAANYLLRLPDDALNKLIREFHPRACMEDSDYTPLAFAFAKKLFRQRQSDRMTQPVASPTLTPRGFSPTDQAADEAIKARETVDAQAKFAPRSWSSSEPMNDEMRNTLYGVVMQREAVFQMMNMQPQYQHYAMMTGYTPQLPPPPPAPRPPTPHARTPPPPRVRPPPPPPLPPPTAPALPQMHAASTLPGSEHCMTGSGQATFPMPQQYMLPAEGIWSTGVSEKAQLFKNVSVAATTEVPTQEPPNPNNTINTGTEQWQTCIVGQRLSDSIASHDAKLGSEVDVSTGNGTQARSFKNDSAATITNAPWKESPHQNNSITSVDESDATSGIQVEKHPSILPMASPQLQPSDCTCPNSDIEKAQLFKNDSVATSTDAPTQDPPKAEKSITTGTEVWKIGSGCQRQSRGSVDESAKTPINVEEGPSDVPMPQSKSLPAQCVYSTCNSLEGGASALVSGHAVLEDGEIDDDSTDGEVSEVDDDAEVGLVCRESGSLKRKAESDSTAPPSGKKWCDWDPCTTSL